MKAWLSRLRTNISFTPSSPEELARFELSNALPDLSFRLETDPSLGEGYRIQSEADGSFVISGGTTGILYGSYALIRSVLCGKKLPDFFASTPRYSLRMNGFSPRYRLM